MAKITPCMENGKAAIAHALQNGLGFGSTEFHILRSNGSVLPAYVYLFIRQEVFRRAAEEEMTGSVGQKRVPAGFLAQADIPLPPFTEQQRIVAKVEALLARVNAARQRLAKVPAILKRFRQAVLAAACSGRLSENWRSCEIEIQRTPNTLADARDGVLDENGETYPKGWRSCTLAAVCSAVVDCPHSTPKWTEAGEICLRTTNFRPGWLDLSEVRFVSPATYRERIMRLEPQAGDVLYSREGGILGIACLIPPNLRACLGQRMMLMRTNGRIQPEFLMHVLNSPPILEVVKSLTGGTASPHLNVGDVKAFTVPVPSLPEQREIVRRIEELFKLADAIEKSVAAATQRTDKLTQAILAKAFRGELVPTEAELARQEGRDYEPASALLERIRAERAGTLAPPKRHARRRKA
jgi:type I restriction enzyme S subunit